MDRSALETGRPKLSRPRLTSDGFYACPSGRGLLSLRANLQSQCVQTHEALRILLVIHVIFLERGDVEAIERLFRFASRQSTASPVEFDSCDTADVFLGFIDCRLHHLALGAEPIPVVDQISESWDQAVAEVE